MQYNIIALALVALGFALLFFIDSLIAKDNQNTVLASVRDNNMVVGLVCLGAGYYVYTLAEKEHTLASPSNEIPESDDLPTYDKATTSTGEILNM